MGILHARGQHCLPQNSSPTHTVWRPTPSASLQAGLSMDFVAPVSELERFIQGWDFDLDDPLTLARFLLGNPASVEEAKLRLEECRAWRPQVDLPRLMQRWGYWTTAEKPPPHWVWQPQTPRAAAVAPYFFGRCCPELRTQSGGPVLVLRLGAFDLEGALRENLVEELMEPWIFMVEQTFQLCREVAFEKKRLVKLACIVDIEGVSFTWLQHLSVLQQFAKAINRHYPEMAQTLTVIRAPHIFTWLWEVAAPLLLEEMTLKKVAILGHDFREGLAAHAGVAAAELPSFLGGGGEEVPRPELVPPGVGARLPSRLHYETTGAPANSPEPKDPKASKQTCRPLSQRLLLFTCWPCR
ncbi:unnamed protein product [Durusdinium trenchii]|uniref:CRAL-TRIO domain-containing protein n=2 Tax=Durusdinium trenchii TaxID=1381693 RepID=A0ABP0R3I6_9DINO